MDDTRWKIRFFDYFRSILDYLGKFYSVHSSKKNALGKEKGKNTPITHTFNLIQYIYVLSQA